MKHFLFAALCLAMSATAGAQMARVTLAAEIKRPNNDSMFLEDENGRSLRGFKLNKKNAFRDTVTVAQGFYHLTDGKEYTLLYLKDGFDLLLTLDTRRFDESVQYRGNGAAENNYLAASYLLEEENARLNRYSYYAKLEEKGFLRLVDSLHKLRTALLKKNAEEMDTAFIAHREMIHDCDRREKLSNYESMHAWLTGKKDFKVSPDFPDPFAGFNLSDERWAGSWEYTGTVRSCLEEMTMTELRAKISDDYYLSYLKNLNKAVSSIRIREKLAYEFGMNRMSLVKGENRDSACSLALSMITDPMKRAEVNALNNRLRKLLRGAPSPTFSFRDVNGKEHSLEDMRGKFVYIDVWATWCGPCLQEIPHLRQLEDSMHGKDIVFVSICKSDERKNWEKMLKTGKLGGLQLFAEPGDDAFFDAYVIQGIPHFILLDREGRIIDHDAKRPSHPELLKQLRALLE